MNQKQFFIPYDESELKAMISDAVKDAFTNQEIGNSSAVNQPPIKGITQLAKFLGISPARAQKLKNDGVLPYWQDGRLIFFDTNEVMKAMRKLQK